MSNMLTRVFVYGTLKRGFPNHHLLENPPNGTATFLDSAHTKEKYPLVIGTECNIPFMLQLPGKGSNIKGEVFEVDQAALVHLDRLEDHPTWYRRTPCQVVLQGTQEINCETYFLLNPKTELLENAFYEEFTADQAKDYSETRNCPRTSSLQSQVQMKPSSQ